MSPFFSFTFWFWHIELCSSTPIYAELPTLDSQNTPLKNTNYSAQTLYKFGKGKWGRRGQRKKDKKEIKL